MNGLETLTSWVKHLDNQMMDDKERLNRIESVLFSVAAVLHRFDILVDAGFELTVNGQQYGKEDE